VRRSQITPPVSWTVGWRLVVGLLPSLVAVALVIGLFYYGEVGRSAPRVVLVVASVLAAVSLATTWLNARYFAARIMRLARAAEGPASAAPAPERRVDEFERIERAVGNLGSALSAAEAERERASAAADAQRQAEATMLAGVVSDSLAQLDEVRLPLHILLESRFGDLNENQEELLRDARNAADTIDTALRRLGQVADADRGALTANLEAVQINDVVRSVAPIARAAAVRHQAQLRLNLEPGLPRVPADRARLAEALALITVAAADATKADRPLEIATARDGSAAVVRLSPSTEPSVFAQRLLTVQGATWRVELDALALIVGAGPARSPHR